jgi:triosephosphate isomerase
MRKILIVGNWKMHISASAYEKNLGFSHRGGSRNKSADSDCSFPRDKGA